MARVFRSRRSLAKSHISTTIHSPANFHLKIFLVNCYVNHSFFERNSIVKIKVLNETETY